MDITLGILAGLATAALTWKAFFSDLEDFFECLRYWLTPDVISLFRGQFQEDWWAEMKLGIWAFLSGITGFATYSALQPS